MRAHSFIFPISGYGLIKAEAKVTMNLENGKLTGIEMNPECFAGVRDRWSLVQEMEEMAGKIHHALYMSGSLIDQNEIDYRREVEAEMR